MKIKMAICCLQGRGSHQVVPKWSSSGSQMFFKRAEVISKWFQSGIQMVSVHFLECVMAVMLNFKEWPYTAYQAVPEALNF